MVKQLRLVAGGLESNGIEADSQKYALLLRYHFYGYSVAALEDLCEKHDYGILTLEYNNAFLAPREIGVARFSDAGSAYREGYLKRRDRKERFVSNSDMEFSLNPEEGMRFLPEFYANDSGNYYLTKDKDSFAEMLSPETLNARTTFPND